MENIHHQDVLFHINLRFSFQLQEYHVDENASNGTERWNDSEIHLTTERIQFEGEMNGNRLRWCQKHSNRCSSNNHVDLSSIHRIRIVWNVVGCPVRNAVAVRLAHRQSRFERQSKWVLVKHLVWTLWVPGSNQCCGVFTWLRLLKPFYLCSAPIHLNS